MVILNCDRVPWRRFVQVPGQFACKTKIGQNRRLTFISIKNVILRSPSYPLTYPMFAQKEKKSLMRGSNQGLGNTKKYLPSQESNPLPLDLKRVLFVVRLDYYKFYNHAILFIDL